ncbi:hypothetical protein BH09BAC5_BH09BAC5_24180 [soil metagenome]
MNENKYKPLLSKAHFYRRIVKSVLVALVFLTFSLLIGILGYHSICGLPWVDSLLNASMILTGMGPVDPMKTEAAKIFASFYAIFSGVAFLSIVALILSPVVHRFLHKFHLEEKD